MNKLRFYFFHLMPYPHIPPASEIQSTCVVSNKHLTHIAATRCTTITSTRRC